MATELETEGRRYVILPLLSHTEVFNAFDLARGPRLSADALMRIVRTHLLAFDAVLVTPGALTLSSTEEHDRLLTDLLESREFNALVDEGFIGTFHDEGNFYDLATYADELVEREGRIPTDRMPLAREAFGRMRYLPRALKKKAVFADAASAKYSGPDVPRRHHDLIERMIDRSTHPTLNFYRKGCSPDCGRVRLLAMRCSLSQP